MIGWGRLVTPFSQTGGVVHMSNKETCDIIWPFSIPQKNNCDLCRIEKNMQKVVENPILY